MSGSEQIFFSWRACSSLERFREKAALQVLCSAVAGRDIFGAAPCLAIGMQHGARDMYVIRLLGFYGLHGAWPCLT